jgi:hypothetical protein
LEEATVKVYVSALAVNGTNATARSSNATAIKTFFISFSPFKVN